jgi:hypothetical protein
MSSSARTLRRSAPATARRTPRALRNLVTSVISQLGPQGITALRDQIANHPYTESLRILGIADFEQKYEQTRL